MSTALKLLKASAFGGATACVFAPLFWPMVALVEDGHLSTSVLSGLPVVALFALLGGLWFAVFIGLPLVLMLWSARLRHPVVLVCAGGSSSAVVFSQFLSWPSSAWHLYLFFFVVGALCSGMAAWRMRSAPIPQADA